MAKHNLLGILSIATITYLVNWFGDLQAFDGFWISNRPHHFSYNVQHKTRYFAETKREGLTHTCRSCVSAQCVQNVWHRWMSPPQMNGWNGTGHSAPYISKEITWSLITWLLITWLLITWLAYHRKHCLNTFIHTTTITFSYIIRVFVIMICSYNNMQMCKIL